MTIDCMIEKIKDILADLPEEFGTYRESDELDNEWQLHNDIQYKIGKCSLAHGVSKMVIISDKCKHVLKVPFNGMWFECYDDNDNIDDAEFVSFECAKGSNTAWNYCEVEAERYANAEKDGFARYFAETRFVDTCGHTPVYAQERVFGIWDHRVKPSEKSKTKAKELKSRLNSTWVAVFIDKYGEEEFLRFQKYLSDYDMIEDLHSENLGFRPNGEPVVIDFSGYDEEI